MSLTHSIWWCDCQHTICDTSCMLMCVYIILVTLSEYLWHMMYAACLPNIYETSVCVFIIFVSCHVYFCCASVQYVTYGVIWCVYDTQFIVTSLSSQYMWQSLYHDVCIHKSCDTPCMQPRVSTYNQWLILYDDVYVLYVHIICVTEYTLCMLIYVST